MLITEETQATRLLGMLLRCHPEEGAKALGLPAPFDPESVRVEKRHAKNRKGDARAVLANGETFGLEAKIDDFVGAGQLLDLARSYDHARLLVVEVEHPTVEAALADCGAEAPDAVEWADVLAAIPNPVAAALERDIAELALAPSTKRRMESAFAAALDGLGRPRRGWSVYADRAESGRPCISVASPSDLVFGQLEGPREAAAPLRFSAKVGFVETAYASKHQLGEKLRHLAEHLTGTRGLVERLGVAITHADPVRRGETFKVAAWVTRGFTGSYIGVSLKPSTDAADLLRRLCRTAEEVEKVATA